MTHRIIRPAFTPYRPGDPIQVLHLDEHGTTTSTITVERCVPLVQEGAWRVTARHADGKLHDVTVYADGNDRHGYASRPTKTSTP